jgi:hypothetical protein
MVLIGRLALVAALGWAVPGMALAAANPTREVVAAESRTGRGGTPATAAEVLQYQQREQQSQQLQQFEGGDDFGIYIGGGAALILLVVLLVLLLR